MWVEMEMDVRGDGDECVLRWCRLWVKMVMDVGGN